MAKSRTDTRKAPPTPTSFEQARDELFSHILRCGVLEASPEHQKEWFDDTMLYLGDRYEDLAEEEVTQLRDRKSTRLNSSHMSISYAVFCLKKKRNCTTPARAMRSAASYNT